MSIFDDMRFTESIPEGYAATKIEFTEEESNAISSSMDEYASIWATRHGGAGYVTPAKMHAGMQANSLAEYASGLIESLEGCDSDEDVQKAISKATKAQSKAYALHNLPIYIFQLASIFEIACDGNNSAKFFGLFLRAYREFRADGIDEFWIAHLGFDMPRVAALAENKLRENATSDLGDVRFCIIPVVADKRQTLAERIIEIAEETVSGYCGGQMAALHIESGHEKRFKCLCFALVLSVAEVITYERYVAQDAEDIMLRAFQSFFDENSDTRIAPDFQDVFHHAHKRYISIREVSVPLLGMTEKQMYEEWAKTFAREVANNKVPSVYEELEDWAFQLVVTIRGVCRRLT